MSGVKLFNNSLVILVVMILALLGFNISKNSIVMQFKQNIFRFMVGQETNLSTGQWDELQTEHYKIKYMPVDKDSVTMVAEVAEQAYTSVSEQMGEVPGHQTTLVIYPDSNTLAASFGWDKNEKALGVYWGGTIRVLSPRVWLNGFDQQERFTKEGPMVHEFTHLMVDEMTRGNYNRWWTEGVAQYMERSITGFEFASPFSANQEIYYYTLDELEKNFDELNQSVAYWESLKAVDYIVEHYGEEDIYIILRNLNSGDTMTKAIEKALGTEYNDFARDFYQYLDN